MNGETLLAAAESGDLERAKKALGRTAERDTKSLGLGKSPVQEALYRGHREVADFLRGHWQLDLFEAAALGDSDRIAQILDSEPESVKQHSYDGWTALHLAAFLGRAEAVELLLQRGAPISALSSNYMANTALHAAVAGAASRPIVEALLRAGSNVNLQAGAGVSPLHLAAARGSTELTDLLIEAAADPSILSDEGKTAADIAEARGHAGLAVHLRNIPRIA